MAERRSDSAVAGPSDAGAAMAMGNVVNSCDMWDKVYDRAFRRRGMQQAVDAMRDWREGAVAQPSSSSVSSAPNDVHVPMNVDTRETNDLDICLSSCSDED